MVSGRCRLILLRKLTFLRLDDHQVGSELLQKRFRYDERLLRLR